MPSCRKERRSSGEPDERGNSYSVGKGEIPREVNARALPDGAHGLTFPDSFGKDIHRRVGSEIPERTFRRALETLVAGHQVVGTGETRWRRYRLNPTLGRTSADGR